MIDCAANFANSIGVAISNPATVLKQWLKAVFILFVLASEVHMYIRIG